MDSTLLPQGVSLVPQGVSLVTVSLSLVLWCGSSRPDRLMQELHCLQGQFCPHPQPTAAGQVSVTVVPPEGPAEDWIS